MYTLSHMITEQRNLLQRLAETSILGDKVVSTVNLVKICQNINI